MTEPFVEIDCAIVGAGVVGLAVAEAVSRACPLASVVVLERHERLGCEGSSHNSEVIHAGIYYRGAPLKARSCREGNRLLYEFCAKYEIPYRRCGKFVVATDRPQVALLERIVEDATANGVGLDWRDAKDARRLLRNAAVEAALWSPSSGIVDSHRMMKRLESLSRSRGVIVMYKTAFERLDETTAEHVAFSVRGADGELTCIRARAFVNAAGLAAARVASPFHPDRRIEIRPCRGRYFGLAPRWTNVYSHLLYPVPDPAGGLGTHLTIDLSGRARLGPDVDWSFATRAAPDDPALYRFDADIQGLREQFFLFGSRILPGLERDDLTPDDVGVRPKLFVDGAPYGDFLVERGTRSRDWHLVGIESPGLTSAMALAASIAREIRDVV